MTEVNQIKKESASLRFLYNTALGRLCLKLITLPATSKIIGAFLDSSFSKPLIKKFVRENQIDLSNFYSENFRCFNDCFSRKIKEDLRPVDMASEAFVSPCDAYLSAYNITDTTILNVKGSEYTISDLLNGDAVAEQYKGGVCLVFRLCVNHYHRYIYVDNGEKSDNVFIPGRLHTVRPIALRTYPVFKQNSREYTVVNTENFGAVTQIEVGALLVGKIKNHHGKAIVKKGEEKGHFLYGGSTIIVLLEKDAVHFSNEIFEATEKGSELSVLLGEKLGTANKNKKT